MVLKNFETFPVFFGKISIEDFCCTFAAPLLQFIDLFPRQAVRGY